MEGPRGLRIEEMQSMKRLADICFWKGLVDKYPQLFNEDNLENLRVIVEDGEVISHVGMTEQYLSVYGCLLQVACIGAVCTHPDYRRRGLATRLFNDACEKAYRDGVDFMMVSGAGRLYIKAGCRIIVGSDYEVNIKLGEAEEFSSHDVKIKKIEEEKDLHIMASIYQREPVRFLRRLEDYKRAFKCKHVLNRQSDFLLLMKGNVPRAYIILPDMERSCEVIPGLRKKNPPVRICEYAGERSTIMESLNRIMQNYSLDELTIRIPKYDDVMIAHMKEKELNLEEVDSFGTLRIINFTQLMERMRLYFEEIIGYSEAEKLRFKEENGSYIIGYESESVVIQDVAEATKLIFGSKDTPIDQFIEKGKLYDILKKILPIPVPWYGMNFV